MAKKFNTNDITKLYNQEFKTKRINLITNGGEEFEIEVQEKLNETTIMELVTDLVDRSNYCTENKIEFNEILNTYFLLIKYFTDIKFSSFKSLEKQYSYELRIIKELIDLGIFEQIIKSFDSETMKRIQDSLEKYSKQMNIVANNKMHEIIEDEFLAKVEIKNEEKI